MGGKDSKTGILGVWDKKLQRWCHPYPPMPTARSGAAVVTLEDRWPTVAGGTCKSGKSEVEISISQPGIGIGVHHFQYLCITCPQ